MSPSSSHDEERAPSRYKIVATLGYLLATVLVAFLLTGIQGNSSKLDALDERVDRLEVDILTRLDRLEAEARTNLAELEDQIEAEIARLDQSNRDRRDSIAALEARAAALEALQANDRADLERLLPFNSDSPALTP